MRPPALTSWTITLVCSTLAFVCVGGVAGPALAQAQAQGDDAQAAKVKFESGARHFDLSEYQEALADFKDAYRLKPDPAFLYNIAQCHRRLGQTEDAIAFYQSYLRRAPDAKNRDEVERRIHELEGLRAAPSGAAPAPSNERAGSEPPAFQPDNSAVPVAQPPAPAPALDLASSSASPSSPSSPATPLYTRWWFWSAVGVAALASATTIIIMATRDPTQVPSSGLGAQKALP